MATPTKLENPKICRCCCKQLRSNDHPISLFGEKSQTEAIMEAYNEIAGLEGYENDGLSQLYVGLVLGKLRRFKNLKLSTENPIVNREPSIYNQGIHAQRGERSLKKPHRVRRYRPQCCTQARKLDQTI